MNVYKHLVSRSLFVSLRISCRWHHYAEQTTGKVRNIAWQEKMKHPVEKLAENRGAADGETDGGKEPKGEMSITTPVESACLPVFMPIHIQRQIQEQIYIKIQT